MISAVSNKIHSRIDLDINLFIVRRVKIVVARDVLIVVVVYDVVLVLADDVHGGEDV